MPHKTGRPSGCVSFTLLAQGALRLLVPAYPRLCLNRTSQSCHGIAASISYLGRLTSHAVEAQGPLSRREDGETEGALPRNGRRELPRSTSHYSSSNFRKMSSPSSSWSLWRKSRRELVRVHDDFSAMAGTRRRSTQLIDRALVSQSVKEILVQLTADNIVSLIIWLAERQIPDRPHHAQVQQDKIGVGTYFWRCGVPARVSASLTRVCSFPSANVQNVSA